MRARASFATLVVVAASAGLMAADDGTQKLSARGVNFEVPKSWKDDKPSSSMRLLQLKVGPEKDDKEAAELALFAFPGGGGSVKQNLDRWQTQFQDENGKSPKLITETRKGKGVDVTYAETSGRYVAAVTPGAQEKFDKADWVLYGAIVQTADTGYFFKMIGPKATMKAAKPAFDAMIKSISVD